MVNHSSGRRRRRLLRPVTVHDMMSYSSSNHGLDNLTSSLKSAGPMECARINGRTGGYDIPNNLLFEPDDVTDASTVKADNTTTATSKELLRFRFTNHTKRTMKCMTEDTSEGGAFSLTSSVNSSAIDHKLRTRLPRLLKGGLRRFNLMRTLDDSSDTFSEESLDEPAMRQRFVLPDEAPPPVPRSRLSPLPRSRPTISLRPEILPSMSSDSEAIEVLTHGDDPTAMIVNSSSALLVAPNEDDDRSSVGGGTYFSGISSVISAMSDGRLMDSAEKGSLRLTTDSLKHHDERQGTTDEKIQTSPPRRLRRPLGWLRRAMQQPEKVKPVDENETRRIEKMRQDYLAKQRARELEAISKEQRDRVFQSICSSSETERKEILREVLSEAKAKASALAHNGYAPQPLVRSTGASVMTMDRCDLGCSAADNVFPSFGV